MCLPPARESPGVVVPVQLSGGAAQEGPVRLSPQDIGRSAVRDQVLEFVVGLHQERRQCVGAVVVGENLRVGRIVGVGGVELDDRLPGRVVERTAYQIVQFDGVDVARVGVPDSKRHRLDDLVVVGALPALKIVTAHPDNIVGVLIPGAEVTTEVTRFRDAVGPQHAQEAPGFRGVENNGQTVLSGELQHAIDPREIELVRRGKIPGCRERDNAVVGAGIGAAGRVRGAQQIDPEHIEAGRLAVREKRIGQGLGEIYDQRLWRIADHKIGDVVLINQVPPVCAWFKWGDWSRGSCHRALRWHSVLSK